MKAWLRSVRGVPPQLGFATALLAGCAPPPTAFSIRFVVAPGDGASCGASATDRRWLAPACASVEVCPSGGGSCVAVAPIEGPYDPPPSTLPVVGGALRFAAMTSADAAVDVRVVVYDRGGRAVARGVRERIVLQGEPIGVVLRAIGGGSQCPHDVSAHTPRAFHSAVRLSNGEVLILGGVGATGVPVLGRFGAITAGVAEVFRPGTEEIARVTVDGDPSALARADFDARWVEVAASGVERIRLFRGTSEIQFVDRHVVDRGDARATVDVLYDPAAETLRVVPVAGLPAVALVEGDDSTRESSHDHAVVVAALAPATNHTFRVFPGTVSGDFMGALEGASLSRVGPARWLLTGGPPGFVVEFDATAASMVRTGPEGAFRLPLAFDGAVVLTGRGQPAVAGAAASPPATVNGIDPNPDRGGHATARLADGGYFVSGGVDGSGQPFTSNYIVRRSSSGFTVEGAPPLRQARFGHTVTALEDGRVLVVGGAVSVVGGSTYDSAGEVEVIDLAAAPTSVVCDG